MVMGWKWGTGHRFFFLKVGDELYIFLEGHGVKVADELQIHLCGHRVEVWDELYIFLEGHGLEVGTGHRFSFVVMEWRCGMNCTFF